MKTTMKTTVLLFLSSTMLLTSCDKDDDGPIQFNGESKQVFSGQVTNWVKIEDGIPMELGIKFDEATLNNLPNGSGDMDENFVLAISQKAKEVTTIDHIELGWNPHGHAPEGIYDLPHFDIHYYMVTEEVVQSTIDPLKMEMVPPPAYLPTNYIAGSSMPKMGKHWVDVTSPELNGETFTQTFIYGSYDGKVTFYEPMITSDFLMNANEFERALPIPEKVTRTGYYPSKLKITKLNGKILLILSNFTMRSAS